MQTLDWSVLLGASALVASVLWWFFVAEARSGVARERDGGPQEITVVVHGGYDPATIRVHAGRPVRLVFDRRETSSCSEELVFPAFGIRRFLPAHEKTAIDIRPATPGTYEFTCGMSMLRGRVVAD